MGVVIESMNMPERCLECTFFDTPFPGLSGLERPLNEWICYITEQPCCNADPYTERMKDCPLKELNSKSEDINNEPKWETFIHLFKE